MFQRETLSYGIGRAVMVRSTIKRRNGESAYTIAFPHLHRHISRDSPPTPPPTTTPHPSTVTSPTYTNTVVHRHTGTHTPVCLRLCFFKSEVSGKVLPHSSQLWGCFLRCMRVMCRVRCSWYGNAFSHPSSGHWRSRFCDRQHANDVQGLSVRPVAIHEIHRRAYFGVGFPTKRCIDADLAPSNVCSLRVKNSP